MLYHANMLYDFEQESWCGDFDELRNIGGYLACHRAVSIHVTSLLTFACNVSMSAGRQRLFCGLNRFMWWCRQGRWIRSPRRVHATASGRAWPATPHRRRKACSGCGPSQAPPPSLRHQPRLPAPVNPMQAGRARVSLCPSIPQVLDERHMKDAPASTQRICIYIWEATRCLPKMPSGTLSCHCSLCFSSFLSLVCCNSVGHVCSNQVVQGRGRWHPLLAPHTCCHLCRLQPVANDLLLLLLWLHAVPDVPVWCRQKDARPSTLFAAACILPCCGHGHERKCVRCF